MIRCLAVDDEEYATDIIASYVRKIPFLTLAGTTTSAVDALSRIQQEAIDLVFLDIQMPDLTGMQFLKLYGNKCPIILTTAYPQHALEGYEYNVIDYLVKPFEFERFLKAARKAFQVIRPEAANGQSTDELPVNPVSNPGKGPDYMFVKGDNKNRFLKVNYDDILFIEGLKNYVSLFTKAGRIVTYQSIGYLAAQLPSPPFCRVHRSYIISIDKIRQINGDMVYIDDHQIPVGDSYRPAFYKFIKPETGAD